MTKTGVIESSLSSAVANATELKKQLQRLESSILEEEEYSLEIIDEIMRILTVLMEWKPNNSSDDDSFKVMRDIVVPDEFKCPISRELMIDPVILATGQTYDRSCILRLMNEGQRKCPQTQQVLYHTILNPNHLVREMIFHWCKEHGIELPKPMQNTDDKMVVDADRECLNTLLQNMSSSLSDQKEAAKELRKLTQKFPSFRDPIDAIIPQLLGPLSGRANTHPDLQEDLITTILNLCIHDSNKKSIAENFLVIPLLIESLISGTMTTRSNAAAALFSLSVLDSNKDYIGKSGALKPLINLLEEGDLLAMKDAACAIFRLCIFVDNKGRAVREGAVRVVVEKIKDGILVDELLAILALLVSDDKAAVEMGDLDVVSCLLSIIRESISERNKENCIAILYTLCLNDGDKLNEIRQEENANGTLSKLAETGTSRAKRKAIGMLERLHRVSPLTHTA